MIRLASYFNGKALLWVKGRADLMNDLASHDFGKADWIWIHCASLGEFEQGRTLIESLKSQTDYKILLSFFSPSGYEKRKDYPKADYITYIPLDTKNNATQFIGIIQPKAAIFIRYEFWFYHLKTLNDRHIPIYLVSASFRKQQLFFKPVIGNWFRQMLSFYTVIFTIDEASVQLLNSYHINHCKKMGDTRADRVLLIAKENQTFDKIRAFKGEQQLIVCGSVWQSDMDALIEAMKNTVGNAVRWVLAPHEVGDKNLEDLENFLAKQGNMICSRYSEPMKSLSNVLIIDNIGILSKIYKYADLVYVGGGFGKGIHNVLEPAVFGKPVFMGIKYGKFPEAKGLIKAGGATSISNKKKGNEKILYYLNHPEERTLMGKRAYQYINSISGATDAIVKEIILGLKAVNSK